MKGDSRSHGLWERTAPAGPQCPALADAIEVDIAVVGAGYTGLSAAIHAAQGGASVAILESEDVGFGGSGRNVGLVNAGMWVMPNALPGVLGDIYGERLVRLLGDAPQVVFDLIEKHHIACEVERQGTLHCAVDGAGVKELEERARQWQALGAPVRVLDAAETAAKIGTRAYRASLLDLRAGTIQPLAYARGLAHVAAGLGVRIFASSAVTDMRESADAWTLRTAGGSVRAKWVIVASNAYTTSPWSNLGRELVRLPYFNCATAPLSDNVRRSILPERQGCWDTRKILSSFRFDQTGRLVFGSVGALSGSGLSVHRNWARRALARLFPQIGVVDFEAEWFGMIGMTANSLPRFHNLARNVVSFSGYNGRGIAPGTVFGRCLAQLALGEIGQADLPLPVTVAAPARLRAAFEAYYEYGAQIAHAVGARL